MTDTTRRRVVILIAAVAAALYVLWGPALSQYVGEPPRQVWTWADRAAQDAYEVRADRAREIRPLGALVLIVGGTVVGLLLVPRR